MESWRNRSSLRRGADLPDTEVVSVSKITRPLLTGSISRKRLFRLLDGGRKRPAVWVSGPPGSGKTTLVAGYVEERALPCLWYEIDEGDADPATFFHYLGLAARRAAPRHRTPLPVLTAERFPSISFFAREYFETLLLRLKSPSVLVFDNYHRIPAESPLHEAIRDFSGSLPKGMNVILVGRCDPPSVFARLRAGGLMATIGWESLRLTPGETEGIARHRLKGMRIPESARILHARADGWAAGLVLLLETHAGGNLPPGSSGRRTPEEVFDYFAGEVFGRLDEPTRNFLVRTSFLPWMTVPLAERLAGENRARRILASLCRGNLFTAKHSAPEPVYRYHPLFREYLQGVAEDALHPREIALLRKAAAEILEEAGQIEEAASLMREMGDWKGLVRAVRKRAASFIAQGRVRGLLDWFSAIPTERIRDDPWLLYWLGACRLPFDPSEGRRRFEEAFRLFEEKGDARGVFLAWAGIVDAIVYGPEGLKPLDPWFAELERLTERSARFPSGEIQARVMCAMIKGLALRRPPSVDMEAWVERANAVCRTVQPVSVRIELLTNLAYCHYHGGDFLRTVLTLDSLKKLVKGEGVPPLARLTAGWVEAAHANMTARYGRCLRVVSEGLELARSSGVHLMDYMLSGHGAIAALHVGDMRGARIFLRKMASTLSTAKPWEACFFHFVAGWEALNRGDVPRAALHAEQSLATSREVGNPWSVALAHLQRAFAIQASGDRSGSERHLAEARRIGERCGMRFMRFACLLAGAYFRLERGKEEGVTESLEKGLAIGREKGYASLFLWHPRFAQKVAGEALEAGIEPGYVETFIRLNFLTPDGALADNERWPWPLKVVTLGRFDILKDGKPVRSTRKVQQKPLLLLKALIALGGRDVPEGRLNDILWPEADGDLAHQSFATTLRRLRKLLGEPGFVRHREGRLTLDSRTCWVDIWAFARMLQRIDVAERGEDPGLGRRDHARLLEKAVAMYEGPFLAGETQPWVVSIRERMRGKFLRCVGGLGRLRERSGEWEKAASCYRRGLEVDDVAEDLYLRLMACYKALGRTAEAVAVYERCRRTLSTVLGVKPSAETEALRRSLHSV